MRSGIWVTPYNVQKGMFFVKGQMQKPIRRSVLRLWLGAKYFTLKRYMFWRFGGLRFAKLRTEQLPYTVFEHKTPLLRKLKNVDMYLQYNKITNLKLAAEKLNGMTVYPGDTFSYWKAIGKPSKRKGYLKGMVLRNGGFFAATGGGLCQMSNLIFWLALHTPLTVIERHRHGYDVFPDSNRTQPFGSGATCFYNYGDLMLKNNTASKYRLHVEVTAFELKGCFTSDEKPDQTYQVYEKEHFMRPEYWGGYSRHNVLFRKTFDAENNITEDVYLLENHAIMSYSPFLKAKNQTEPL
jgi:vancomycin resistance protein VanW